MNYNNQQYPGYGYQQMPPNPMGNIIGIGNNGYNNNMYSMGGYYSGNYNYMNPYMLRQQRQLQEIQMREQAKQQSDMMKFICKSANPNVSDEDLQKFDPIPMTPQQMTEDQLEDMTTRKLLEIRCNPQRYQNIANINYINNNNRITESCKKYNDMDLYDFLEGRGTELYIKAVDDRIAQEQRQLGYLYNSDQYRTLTNRYSNGGYFNSQFNNMYNSANIGDIETHLPPNIKNDIYAEKRKRFLDTIKFL